MHGIVAFLRFTIGTVQPQQCLFQVPTAFVRCAATLALCTKVFDRVVAWLAFYLDAGPSVLRCRRFRAR